ncbi:hypothetical protein [Shewanella baltica]|uniref:hypothetical protein n=1 Tax=Shewanella baltica TaxID=62322 RepID=UPI000DF8C2A3|nr:hypothetical protein [Shewanella baltica]SUI78360.1 Uncharacterised protein [Shewanella baltica]
MMETSIAKNTYRILGMLLITVTVCISANFMFIVKSPDFTTLDKYSGVIERVEINGNQLDISIDNLDFTYSRWNGRVPDVFSDIKSHQNGVAELLVYNGPSGNAQIYAISIDSEVLVSFDSIIEHRNSLIKWVLIISIIFCSLGFVGVFWGGQLVEMNRKITQN